MSSGSFSVPSIFSWEITGFPDSRILFGNIIIMLSTLFPTSSSNFSVESLSKTFEQLLKKFTIVVRSTILLLMLLIVLWYFCLELLSLSKGASSFFKVITDWLSLLSAAFNLLISGFKSLLWNISSKVKIFLSFFLSHLHHWKLDSLHISVEISNLVHKGCYL